MKFSRLALAAALSGALLLSACSSSDSSGGSSDPGSDSSGPITAADVATALEYVGGEGGKADSSLEPFKIGFVNNQGALPSFPEQEKAADAVVDFINSKLGGVDGHPVELVKCFIQAEEDGQKCAGQLLEADVPIGNLAVSVYGNATLYKLIGGKFPTIVTVSTTAPDSNTKDVYALDGGGISNLFGMVQNAKKFGDNISVIGSNNPAGKYLMDEVVVPYMKSIGIKPTVNFIADTATTPDYVSALQTSGAAKSDGIYIISAGVQGCVGLYDAMKQISLVKPVAAVSGCGNDPMPEKTGGGPEGWQITGLTTPVFIDSPQATATKNILKAAGDEAVANVGFASKGIGDLLSITKFARTIGFDKLTPEAFQEQIAAFKGPAWLVPGTIACGTNKTQISLCGNASANYEYKDGKWTLLDPYVP
ncbi:hypothetical protein BH09ACT10_BH09ACT10_26560 [soil metagenome]